MTVPSPIEVATLLRRTQLRKQAACETALNRLGMTMAQWGMAHAIATTPDSSTHALALFTGQSDQAAGAVVAKLLQQDLIERHSMGGKSLLHRLTPSGRDKLQQSDAVITEVMDRLLTGLSNDQLRTLETCLIAIAEAASTATGHASRNDRTGLSGNRTATDRDSEPQPPRSAAPRGSRRGSATPGADKPDG